MMKNKETFLKTNDPPRELLQALEKFEQNGDPYYLSVFINKNGIQENIYNLSNFTERIVQQFVENGVSRIEKTMDYNSVFNKWKLLANTGLLSKEILKKGIDEQIKLTMLRSPKETDSIFEATGIKLNNYSADFIEKFKKDLSEQIKVNLKWEIKL